MAQVKANKTEANAKTFSVFLDAMTQESGPAAWEELQG
jgi:hypothetical protein